MADERLYESAAVWDQQLQVGQRNLIRAICDHWPEGAGTALDVGCGDGKITHALAERTSAAFHGFDGSREALSRLRLPSTHGDVSALPFDDKAFDVVLTTDVFEHLPDQVEQAAWQELFRVARDWVFLAVPFREELLDATTVCTSCGERYHVNWHQRSYDFARIADRVPPGWSVARTVISGERWSPMLPPETRYRRLEMNEWSGWTEAVCPACGADGSAPGATAALPADVARALGRYVYEVASERPFVRSHSEILVIFCRTGLDLKTTGVEAPATERISAASWIPCLGFAENLDPYPQVARMVSAVGGGFVAQFPVYPGSLPRLSFAGCRSETVAIVVEDGSGLLFSGEVALSAGSSTQVTLPRDVRPGYYGLLVRIRSADPFEAITLEGAAPSVLYMFPAEGRTSYYTVPDTTVHVQATCPSWIDCNAMVSSSMDAGRVETSALRALLKAERDIDDRDKLERELNEQKQQLAVCRNELSRAVTKCSELAEHCAQQESLSSVLAQDKNEVMLQLAQLRNEHADLQSSFDHLHVEAEKLKERTEVRLGNCIRRGLRAHKKSRGA